MYPFANKSSIILSCGSTTSCSSRYNSALFSSVDTFVLCAVFLATSVLLVYIGITITTNVAIITITSIISIKVKPKHDLRAWMIVVTIPSLLGLILFSFTKSPPSKHISFLSTTYCINFLSFLQLI